MRFVFARGFAPVTRTRDKFRHCKILHAFLAHLNLGPRGPGAFGDLANGASADPADDPLLDSADAEVG